METFLKNHFFQLMGGIVVVLNLWLSTRLAGITMEVKLLDQRVNVFESTRFITAGEFDQVIARLKRIENKLDTF